MDSKIFSLEIFIDRIRLAAGEKCLFPSTILKLLSYEPALISNIDLNVQDNLRDYIDPVERLGQIMQIEQLKDADGNFIIRKGKSILFESNTVSLMNEFSVLPVYILVTDDYFVPCHLIGVVAINLSSVMRRLSQKISNTSITVSEDTGGKFPIVNLMGDGIGALTLRLRLIYVGENIGRHMVQEQEIEIRPKNLDVCETSQKSVGADSPQQHYNLDCTPTKPETTMVRNIGCQADEKRSIHIQVPPKPFSGYLNKDKVARIGLSLDPNDPLLEGPPPLIYNSQFDNNNYRYDDEISQKYVSKHIYKEIGTNCLPETHITPNKHESKDMPILNALFSELKAWKSEDFVEEIVSPKKILVTNRSKSVEVRPPINISQAEFLKRMSKPKARPVSPIGMVPRNLGWIRTQPQFVGPKKSSLEYKLTKTQLRRIELRNPRLYNRILSTNDAPQLINSDLAPTSRKQPHERRPKQMYHLSVDKDLRIEDNIVFDNSATTYTELPLKQRHPLVPPLFNPGTSISVPSFTQTDSSSPGQGRRDSNINERKHRLPPKLPDKQRNSTSQTMSFETNGTLDEAEPFLNLNPVQSNKSPQMTTRSQTTAIGLEDATEDDEEESFRDRQQQYGYNNRSDEYSDEFNGSFSSSNGPISVSRRYSNASQTYEFASGYSPRSSVSQNYSNKHDSPPQSPTIGSYQSPPKSPVKSRKSLLATGIVPGGRFSDFGASRQMRSSGSFAASFDESADRTNYTTSGSVNVVTERGQDEETMLGSHGLRPPSAGADVTSITKVTKFDRSLAPGRQSNNYLGTNNFASTAASQRTDDSQMLTSESFS